MLTAIAVIIQAVGEFLPISSSAHLSILSWVTHTHISVGQEIALHVGSLLALILYYRHLIWHGFKQFLHIPLQSLGFKLIVLCLPAVIVGLLVNKHISCWHTPLVIGGAAICGGVLLIWADRTAFQPILWHHYQDTHYYNNMTYKQVLIIGCWQIFALIPGMSRMGMILTGARFLGIDRTQATHLAFITAMPMILGAVILNWKNISLSWTICSVASLGLLVLHVLLFFIPRITYFMFGIYRIILGVLILKFH